MSIRRLEVDQGLPEARRLAAGMHAGRRRQKLHLFDIEDSSSMYAAKSSELEGRLVLRCSLGISIGPGPNP